MRRSSLATALLVLVQIDASSSPFATKAGLKAAIQLWVSDRDAALRTYGPISGWDVSLVTDMSELFQGLTTFNEDVSRWNTSGVTDMSFMFYQFYVCPLRACLA